MQMSKAVHLTVKRATLSTETKQDMETIGVHVVFILAPLHKVAYKHCYVCRIL